MSNNLKKWFIVSVLLGTMTMGLSLASAQQISDVPPGHWAYEAVRTLVSKGYLPLGTDEPFLGNEPTDRFTLATVVAKIVDEIESGRVATNLDDVEVLRKVVEEMRSDLVRYYSELQRVAGDITKKDATIDAVDERLMDTIGQLGLLYSRVERLSERLDEAVGRLDGIDISLHAMAGRIDENKMATALLQDEMVDRFAEEQLARAEMDARLQNSLNNRLAQLMDDMSAVQAELSTDLTDMQHDTSEQFTVVADAIKEMRQHLNEHTEALFAQEFGLSGVVQQLDARTVDLDAQIEAQRSRLIAQNDQLTQQLNALDDKLQSLRGDLVGTGDATSAQLSGVDVAIRDLQQELRELRDDVADQQLRLATNLDGLGENFDNALTASNEATSEQFSRVDKAVNEIREGLNSHAESLLMHQVALDDLEHDMQLLADRQDAALADRIGGLDEALAAEARVLSSQLQSLGQKVQSLETELGGKGDATTEQLGRVDEAIGEIRVELNTHAEDLAMQQLALDGLLDTLSRQTEAFARTDGQLLETVEELRRSIEETRNSQAKLEDTVRKLEDSLETDVTELIQQQASINRRMDEIQSDLLITQSQIGLSEEQVNALTRRVRDDLSEQLTLSLLREGQLDKELKDLRQELDGYRHKTEEDIKGVKSGAVVGYLGLAAGLIALFVK